MRSASGEAEPPEGADVRPAGGAGVTAGDGGAGRGPRPPGALPRVVAVVVVVLTLVVMGSVVRRLAVDVPNLATGTVPDPDEYDYRYALHPVLAWLHIVVGVGYLVAAPVQLSRRVGRRHLALQRRLHRWVVLPAGLLTGVSAIIVGVVFPFDGFCGGG
jgi:hypothetical protein